MGTFGCRLINGKNRDFMWDYDPKYGTNAAVRVSTRAMAKEVREGRGPIAMDQTTFFYSLVGRRMWRSMLPGGSWQRINEFRLEEIGHDVTLKPDPFYPCAFGIIGAVKAGVDCSTGVPGLFVAGITLSHDPGKIKGCESARAMWSGENSALSAAAYLLKAPPLDLDPDYAEAQRRMALEPLGKTGGKTPNEVLTEVQKILFDYEVSIFKNEARLQLALEKIMAIQEGDLPAMSAADPHELVKYHETRNMVECAELFLRASLERRETRECHFREDYPAANNKEWLKWINFTKGADGRPEMTLEEVPLDRYPIQPPEEAEHD